MLPDYSQPELFSIEGIDIRSTYIGGDNIEDDCIKDFKIRDTCFKGAYIRNTYIIDIFIRYTSIVGSIYIESIYISSIDNIKCSRIHLKLSQITKLGNILIN